MAVAFKEWALVCEALGRGDQCIILRKGGIEEGKDGFSFKHEEFYLFPTWFHGQVEKIRGDEPTFPERRPEAVTLRFAAAIEWDGRITDKEKLNSLRELHILEDSVIEERFAYNPSGNPGDEVLGIHVAFVRVFRLEPPAEIKMDKSFGGCRSWVELPDLITGAMVSVLSEEEHNRRRKLFSRLADVSF